MEANEHSHLAKGTKMEGREHPPFTHKNVSLGILEMIQVRLKTASLKGYSGVSLIHGLIHCETVLDSLSRDQVSRPLIYGVLSTSETAARQQYTAVNGSKYKPSPKSHK